jgi:hypothetical protein
MWGFVLSKVGGSYRRWPISLKRQSSYPDRYRRHIVLCLVIDDRVCWNDLGTVVVALAVSHGINNFGKILLMREREQISYFWFSNRTSTANPSLNISNPHWFLTLREYVPRGELKKKKRTDAVWMMDDCPSHITDDVMDLLPASRVRVITCALYTTQTFQLLDLTLFRIFKREEKYYRRVSK